MVEQVEERGVGLFNRLLSTRRDLAGDVEVEGGRFVSVLIHEVDVRRRWAARTCPG